MLASAGFGCHFAYTQGVHHGAALAACAVAMALGLELAKPFAIEGVFSCLRTWAIGRALAMALLGFVAVAYSLTAELSLMASTRADGAAERTKASDTAKDDRAELARLTSERAAMAFTPATAETVTAAREAVAAAERTRKAECGDGSAKQRGPNCRAREADEAAARAALTKTIADKATTDRAAKLDTDAASVRGRLANAAPVAGTADPGAAALAGYLATFGLSVPPSLLAQWLVLVAVLALELGSALAVVLVRAAGAPHRSQSQRASVDGGTVDNRDGRSVDSRAPGAAVSKPAPPKRAPLATPQRTTRGQSKGKRLGPSDAVSKADAGARIVDTLQAQGGRIEGGSVRGLAALIGGRKSTVHNALAALIGAGVVAKAAGGALVLTAAG
jgi:hypothetical protein